MVLSIKNKTVYGNDDYPSKLEIPIKMDVPGLVNVYITIENQHFIAG